MTTSADLAKKYGKTNDEVKAALAAHGFKGHGVYSKVEPAVERQLNAYFLAGNEQSKPAAKPSSTSRSIDGVQVTTKKKRTFQRPSQPTADQSAAKTVTASAAPKQESAAPTTDKAAKPVAVSAAKTTSTAAVKTTATEESKETKAAPTTDKTAAAKTTIKAKTETTKTETTKTASATQTTTEATQTEKAATQAEVKPSPPDLYAKQIAAQKERQAAVAESAKQTKAAAETKDTKAAKETKPPQATKISKAETKTPPEKKKIGRGKTIGIDEKILAEHQKRRQQRTPTGKRLPVNQHGFKQPVGPVVREVPLPETISVSKLAGEMSVKSSVIIRKLMDYGIEEATPNTLLKREEASVLVEEFGHNAVPISEEDLEESILSSELPDTDIVKKSRPPVVTIMGHVDHGKTSLLDYIRKTRVAGGEAGGITQHIGAYQVVRPVGSITFLDTPGHALFSQMRARGVQITDIVVLVVAGDDGIKPQTEEAIAHVQAADNVSLVVAVNKIDKPGVDMERIKSELSSHGVLPEDWGGDAIVVPISAHTGEGIDTLLDAIHTQSDIIELKAAWEVPAQATVVDACVDKGRGVVATVIISEGVLRRNDYVVCGTESGRVRAMWDGNRNMLEEAPPSTPVEIQGLSGMPEVGESLLVVQDERKAREFASMRQDRYRLRTLNARAAVRSVSSILSGEINGKKELNVIVKADMGGSREALTTALTATSGKRGAIKVIHSAVGGVSESDINLARASNAVIIAFNVRPDGKSRKLAQSYNIKIMSGNVIYEIIENAKKAVLDLLDAEREEKIIGMAEVLKVFAISKLGNIAGCRVSEGIIRADVRARLVRDGAMVYEGDIHSLRHFKEKTEEVRNGEECGISIHRFNDIKVGDVIEAVQIIETPPTL